MKPIHDFERIPLDFTPLIRKQLPLVEVDMDSGPLAENELSYMRSSAMSQLQTTYLWFLPIDVILLVNWALDGMVPVGDRLGVEAPL